MTARAGWVSFGTFTVCRLNLINTKAVGGRRTTAGSWDSSGSHYGPVGSGQQTCGWWLGGEFKTASGSAVSGVTPGLRWGKRRVCDCGSVTQRPSRLQPPRKTKQKKRKKIERNKQTDPAMIHLQILPSPSRQKQTTAIEKTFLSDRPIPENLQHEFNTAEKISTNHIPNCHPRQIIIRFFSVALKPQCLYPVEALLTPTPPLPVTPPPPPPHPLLRHLSCSCLSVAVLTIFSPHAIRSLISRLPGFRRKPTRTVTWPLGAATLSVTNLCCRVFK